MAGAETFRAKIAEIQKRDNLSPTDAMRRARIEHPADFEALQAAAPDVVEKSGPPGGRREPSDAEQRLMDAARAIAQRDKIPLSQAMTRARRESPELIDRMP